MGTSGISISCLTFEADGVTYTQKQRAPYVAVAITRSDGNLIALPQFWVDKRSVKNGIVTFTCYDTLAFADSLYFAEDDFDNTTLKSLGEINTMAVLSVIEKKMQKGNSLSVDNGGMGANCRFDSDALIGQTVSSVLETIASCSCGYWCISNNNTLKLVRFDGYNCNDSITAFDYTAPDIGESMDINGIDATLDSGGRYSYRYNAFGTGYIIDLNTNGALTSENIDMLGASVCGEDKYTYWSVEKAFLDYVPELGASLVDFGSTDKQLIVNNITATIDSTGVTCALSANEVSGGEIGQSMGEITRRLANTIQSGEVCGDNVMMTKYQGLVFVEGGSNE